MYKTFTAADYRRHLSLDDEYTVDGFLVYGTYRKDPYQLLRNRLAAARIDTQFDQLPGFLESILEFRVNGKRYWFVKAYGGALLSEWLHLACLFGSRKNIVMGSCGGLLKEAAAREIILPTFSYANESPTRAYEPDARNRHYPDKATTMRIADRLRAQDHTVWEGPTVTFQAMMAETWDDVQSWSKQGFYGVEMEAATVFAVSNYFHVPAAALLLIGDNLINGETVFDINFEKSYNLRLRASQDMMDAALAELLDLERL